MSAVGYQSSDLQFNEMQLPPTLIQLRPVPTPVVTAAAGGGHKHTRPPPPPPPPATTGKNPDNRPRTDNIDPWEK